MSTESLTNVCSDTGSIQKPCFWKTTICKRWVTTSSCEYGELCNFAHGRMELCCRYFQAGVTCQFGDACKFRHTNRPKEPRKVEVQPYRYRICQHWHLTAQPCLPDCGYAHGYDFLICPQYHRMRNCSIAPGLDHCSRGRHIYYKDPGGSLLVFSFPSTVQQSPLPFNFADSRSTESQMNLSFPSAAAATEPFIPRSQPYKTVVPVLNH